MRKKGISGEKVGSENGEQFKKKEKRTYQSRESEERREKLVNIN